MTAPPPKKKTEKKRKREVRKIVPKRRRTCPSFRCSVMIGKQRHVITTHMEERGANEPSLVSRHHFLDHCLLDLLKSLVFYHSRLNTSTLEGC